ncbi:hypothetical protein B0H10DRAFT_1870746 [Mycena sp. CBHHK59/15]|nr:hypothetical protein B0H10DRAFT_1870746 [Mycena sp. CBHHK59/15]
MESHASQQSVLKQIDDLWFLDGSLTLRAENTVFRVYREVLAARSPVFRDMLSFPQPGSVSSAAEHVDGVPLVEMHDPAVEVEPFLRAIFDSAFFMPPPSKPYISDVVSILRLSHKYDIQYLHRRALHHLARLFPTTLEDYLDTLYRNSPDYGVLENVPDIHIRILKAVHEVNALWLLPVAYSRASIFPPSTLLSATPGDVEEIRATLSVAYDHRVRHIATIVRFLALQICTSKSPTCNSGRLSLIAVLMRIVSDGDKTFEPWAPWSWDDMPLVCAACVDSVREQHSDKIEKLWNELPAPFGLPAWDVLEAMRVEVME